MSGLHAKDITHRFASRCVLNKASLHAKRGELTAVIGPNGAGKSTLLRVLAGIVEPAAGQVLLDDTPIAPLARRELAKHIAFVPQATLVPPEQNLEDYVLLGRYAHRSPWQSYAEEDYAALERALKRMRIDGLKQRLLSSLSGGEMQRAVLARAIAQEASFILLDEPANNLDPAHVWHTLESLRSLANQGHGVVMVLHDLQLACRYADTIALVHEGEVCQGTVQQIITPQALARCFSMEVTVSLDPPARVDFVRAVRPENVERK